MWQTLANCGYSLGLNEEVLELDVFARLLYTKLASVSVLSKFFQLVILGVLVEVVFFIFGMNKRFTSVPSGHISGDKKYSYS